jgi:hypothetical protein
MVHGVFVLDREPSDPMVGSPVNPTDKTVQLSDRDGNTYVGTLVLAAETYTEACHYVEDGYRTGVVEGRLIDGNRVEGLRHEVPKHGLVIVELAKRPREGAPLKLCTV